jgi:predicted DNA-binding protein (MmcQ/YjbR family)
MAAANSSKHVETLSAALAAMPGAAAEMGKPNRGVTIYKVMGKMFAILSANKDVFVILKAGPYLAQQLRAQYEGVGHRSHLDRRFWVAISLDADVPMKEIKRTAKHSYELVCTSLTKKQQDELAALSSKTA